MKKKKKKNVITLGVSSVVDIFFVGAQWSV